ncbi:MAG: DUF4139 domain-containing protein [Prevotellaceae bacterium]|nr:DUF4139 domain-containing protein [Prevotellaceae bacterium]
MKKLFLALILLVAVVANATKSDELISKVKEVTVFFSGAEIVCEATVNLVGGVNEVTVGGLSNSIEVNSVRIATSNGTMVSSFEYLHKPAQQDAAVKQMQDSLDDCLARREKIRNDLRVETDFKQTLSAIVAKIGSTDQASVDGFVKTIEYYEKKLKETEDLIFKQNIHVKKLEKEIAERTKAINREKTGKGLTQGLLKLSLSSPATAACRLQITYYTPLASWIPYHDVSVSDINKPVKITSKAKVSQSTGTDWKQVALKLSTSVPSFGKTAPLFNAWMLRQQPDEVVVVKEDMNIPAPSMQNILAYSVAKIVDETEIVPPPPTMNEHIELADNTMNITYNIDLPYTVAGNGTVQNIELITQEIAAEYKHYCAPKLDPQVYLIADLRQWEKLNLLNGMANITYDGTFVGETFINAASTGDVLSLTLGVDRRVAVKREKINEMTGKKTFGNDLKQEFSYRLTVRNNQSRPIKMVLKDQYPISTLKQVEVVLLKDITPPDFNKPELGVVTWEQEIGAGELKTYTFGYSVKYPKDMILNL